MPDIRWDSWFRKAAALAFTIFRSAARARAWLCASATATNWRGRAILYGWRCLTSSDGGGVWPVRTTAWALTRLLGPPGGPATLLLPKKVQLLDAKIPPGRDP